MKGQINERVFKVLGAGGCPVVDAVPAYRELYAQDELLMAETPEHFHKLVRLLLSDKGMNELYRLRGRKATLERHTYIHRAVEFMKACGVEIPGSVVTE
jgi:spore maturation protein CgeB